MRRKRPEPINICRNEDLSDIRKAVETTTRADIVIAIGERLDECAQKWTGAQMPLQRSLHHMDRSVADSL